uniref:Peptidase A1 domain-containing protein n=1 Tax=Hanusia phi TaxID=3032 RepID=A0A7S0NCV4_9CRYP
MAVPTTMKETGRQAAKDFNAYFAREDVRTDVRELEDFARKHADQMARDELPCDTDPSFKVQCASVSRHARMHTRKFKVADEKSSNKLFDEAYRPQDSRHFDASKSSTFVPQTSQTFDLNYADGSHLRGFSGVDQVYMGDYKATSPFGVITDCNSPDFNGVDGILGFGLPKAGSDLPTPVLFAMTDAENKDTNAANLKRKFSFFSTDDAAEVQLGGYDPATTSGTMWYTPALASDDFIVGVTSLKFGDNYGSAVELLQFRSKAQRNYGAPSIMDSGTSCLVIPADSMQGQLANVPWDDFAKHWKKGRSFWLEIGQKTWEVPFSSWYLAETDQTCVQPSPEGMQGLLVGDVFFREYIVEFDMTGHKPIIGIAPLNKHYVPVTRNVLANFELNTAPVAKLRALRGNEVMYPAQHQEVLTQVDRIPIVNQKGTQYFMDVGIGTPRQTFTVIFDTGSTVFGVFANKHDLPAHIKNQLPGYYFSENLHSLAQTSVRVREVPFFQRIAGSSVSAVAVLAVLNVVMIALIVVARRKRSGKRQEQPVRLYGAI